MYGTMNHIRIHIFSRDCLLIYFPVSFDCALEFSSIPKVLNNKGHLLSSVIVPNIQKEVNIPKEVLDFLTLQHVGESSQLYEVVGKLSIVH